MKFGYFKFIDIKWYYQKQDVILIRKLNLIKRNKNQMRSYSQQNDIMEQQNSRIADIYQKMLMGDKLTLGNLQSVKIINTKNHQETQNNVIQSHNKKISSKNMIENKEQENQNTFKTKEVNLSPYKRTTNKINIIQQQLLQESIKPNINKNQKQIENSPQSKQKFNSFIKSKVNQLRNQKKNIQNQQQKDHHQIQIQTITKTIKLSINNQSKSYDLVRKKQLAINQSIDHSMASPLKKVHPKQKFQNVNIKQNLKKTQSSVQNGTNKHLPPINQKRKVPTQNSQHNSQLNDSNYRQRTEIRTPISLANFQNKDSQYRKEQVSIRDINQKEKQKLQGKQKVQKKVKQSRAIRVPLPELKKQKQQFGFINEQQRSLQLDLIQYHQKTKTILQNVKNKYILNFNNNNLLDDLKRQMNPQPVLNSYKRIPKNEDSKMIQNENHTEKKKHFDVLDQKINKSKNEIEFIDQMISKKRVQMKSMSQNLNKNSLVKYWFLHDLYTSDFEDVSQQNDQQNGKDQSQFSENHSTKSSNIRQAYSTSMANSKEKGWKSKAIKQYDTNRSFQQYAKSRGLLKQSKHQQEFHKSRLKKIQQNEDDQQQQKQSYQVTVNSRLKRLLLD